MKLQQGVFMKVTYAIEKRESESKKKTVLQNIINLFGTKVSINGSDISIDKNEERKIVELLVKSGVKFQKVS